MANRVPRRARTGLPQYGMLPELIGYHLRRAQVSVFADFVATTGTLDITPGQFGVLELIACNPGLNQTGLGEAMGVDRSTVVAVIDRLEERHLVRRSPAPGDRRSYALELTHAGAALLEQLRPVVRAHEARIAAGLAAEEQRALIEALRRIAER